MRGRAVTRSPEVQPPPVVPSLCGPVRVKGPALLFRPLALAAVPCRYCVAPRAKHFEVIDVIVLAVPVLVMHVQHVLRGPYPRRSDWTRWITACCSVCFKCRSSIRGDASCPVVVILSDALLSAVVALAFLATEVPLPCGLGCFLTLSYRAPKLCELPPAIIAGVRRPCLPCVMAVVATTRAKLCRLATRNLECVAAFRACLDRPGCSPCRWLNPPRSSLHTSPPERAPPLS